MFLSLDRNTLLFSLSRWKLSYPDDGEGESGVADFSDGDTGFDDLFLISTKRMNLAWNLADI
jgi:hypothetical protein